MGRSLLVVRARKRANCGQRGDKGKEYHYTLELR